MPWHETSSFNQLRAHLLPCTLLINGGYYLSDDSLDSNAVSFDVHYSLLGAIHNVVTSTYTEAQGEKFINFTSSQVLNFMMLIRKMPKFQLIY